MMFMDLTVVYKPEDLLNLVKMINGSMEGLLLVSGLCLGVMTASAIRMGITTSAIPPQLMFQQLCG